MVFTFGLVHQIFDAEPVAFHGYKKREPFCNTMQ